MDGGVMEKALEGLGSVDLSMQNLRRTLDQLRDRASSVLLFTLQWKDIQEQFDSMRNGIEARAKEVQALDESVRGRVMELEKKEERVNKVEARQKELDSIRESIREKLKELEKKEKEFDSRQKEETERKKEEIELMEKSSKQLESSVDEKLKEFDKKAKELVSFKKSTEKSFKELKIAEERVRKEREEIALNLKQLKSCTEEFEMKKAFFESKEKKLEQWAKELELKEKELEERSKKLKTRPEFGPLVSLLAKHVTFSAPMDENSSLIYLNGSRTGVDDDLMKNRADLALQILSLDPAKLVLDAVQGSYQPYLKKGDSKSDASNAVKSCVVLLEKLMRMNPKIVPEVKKEATALGIDWFDKVATSPENEVEVLGCLLFMAVYGLSLDFAPQLVFKLLEHVTLHEQAPKLFQLFGFKHKVSGVVHTLIGKEEYFAAIRFICEFRTFTRNKAANLLHKYLNSSKKAARRIVGTENSPAVQKAVVEKRKADVVVALEYIKEKKSENIFPIKILENEIASLEKQLAATNEVAPTQDYQGQRVHPSNEKCHSLSNNMGLSASVSATDATVSYEQQSRTKRQRTTEPTDSLCTPDPCQNPAVNGCAGGLVTSLVKIKESTENHQPKTAVPSSSSLTTEPKPNVPFGHISGDALDGCGSGVVASQVKIKKSTENHQPKTTVASSSSLITEPKPDVPSCDINGDDSGVPVDKHFVEETDLSDFLQCAPDPAKLVLDTVMDLYPSNLEGDFEFRLRVSPDRCFFLLDQLKRHSPQIKHAVKDEAKKLAISWKSKLSKNNNNNNNNKSDRLEVVCFLQFLGIFKVVSEFKADELLALLDSAPWQTVSPDLCQFLGLDNEIPRFIQSLIKTGRSLKAINYIFVFGMVERFPPVPILNGFLKYTNEFAENSLKNNKTVPSQVAAINRQIKGLRDAVQCISHHKLESQFNLSGLNESIRLLFKRKSQLKFQPDGSKPENNPDSSNPQTQKAMPDLTNTQTLKVMPDSTRLQTQKKKSDSVKPQTQRKNPGSTNPQTQKTKLDSINPQTQETKADPLNTQTERKYPDSTKLQTQKTKSGPPNPQTHWKTPNSTTLQTQRTEPVPEDSAAAPTPSEASSASKLNHSNRGTSNISGTQHAKEIRRRRKRRWGNEQTSARGNLSGSYEVASYTSNYYNYYSVDRYTSNSTWAAEDYSRGIPRNHISIYSYLHGREVPSGLSLQPYHPYNPFFGSNFQF